MDFQFIIPSANGELLNSDGNNYFVKKVFDAKELPELLKDTRNALTTGLDPFYIFDHFDTYFSLIENAKSVSLTLLLRGSDLLYLTIDKLGKMLELYLSDDERSDRAAYLNLVKMIMFLDVGLVYAIDSVTVNPDSSTKKGIKKVQATADFDIHEWNEKRYKILIQVYNIFQMPLERLWSINQAEENFVNMICELGYRTLEHQSIKEKRICDLVFQILGLAIKRYNHAITFPVRILHILRTCEMAVGPAAHGVHLIYKEFNIATIFSALLKDLIDTLGVDAADSQTSKNFSQFLSELGTEAPKLLIPHLSILGEELLGLESYVLRNCVLQIMGDVVTVELSAEDLSDEMKEIRDEFLEDLLDHMMDVSAHVRSKVLQIWNHMKTEHSVPLVWQLKVLVSAADRLDDRATLVRKNATILIKSFLETNPYSHKLSLEELTAQHEEEMEKMQKLREEMIEIEKRGTKMEELWMEIYPELMVVIAEVLNNVDINEIEQPIEEDVEFVKRITELILAKEFKMALSMVRMIDVENRERIKEMSFDDKCTYYAVLLRSYLFIDKDLTEQFTVIGKTIQFLDDSIQFSRVIAVVIPKLENMLMSKSNTDVFEAIDFFTTAYLFGIKGTECGMRKMLCLVWTDKEKREAVTKAYHRVLFRTDLDGRSHAIKVVDNLCSFFEIITIGQNAAMEELMKEWIDNGDVDSKIIQVLFERFSLKLPDTSNSKARCSLHLLSIAASVKPSIASSNTEVIQTIGFNENGFKDSRIFTACIKLLTNLSPSNASTKYYQRYDRSKPVIENTIKIFKHFFFAPQLTNFDEVVISTFDLLYRIAQAPDIICQELLIELCQQITEISTDLIKQDDQTNNGCNKENKDTQQIKPNLRIPEYLLSRFIFLFGYIAMKEMVFLDIDVYNNMKYRQDILEENKNKKNKNNNRRKTGTLNMSASASHALKRLSGSAAEPQQEPDDMLEGASAEDSIAELILFICESELLYNPTGMLHNFIPIVCEILQYPGKYPSESLQQSACLTLLRFMTVSSKFCESKMSFLMNLLNLTKNTKTKCNIIIGLSDFTFRFPNVIQSWTGNIYATLQEPNDEIRLTAVKMLSHLILHEMIRVKGQISALAICIVDSNAAISDISKTFFKEISQKSNILYNVLPDIISRLSGSEMNLEEDKYHEIMKYIIGLIEKDRHVESLVEKLCLRFRVTSEERQWRDIAYCLSLLSFTEKTIRKLIDNVQYFKDKVQVHEVYECFKTIISNTNRLAKPELKILTADLAARLEDCLTVKEPGAEQAGSMSPGSQVGGARNDNMMPPPNKIPKRGRKIQPKSKSGGGGAGGSKTPNRRQWNSDSDSDDDSPPRSNAISVRNSARKRNNKKTAIVDDSDSGDSSSDEPPKKTLGRSNKATSR